MVICDYSADPTQGNLKKPSEHHVLVSTLFDNQMYIEDCGLDDPFKKNQKHRKSYDISYLLVMTNICNIAIENDPAESVTFPKIR